MLLTDNRGMGSLGIADAVVGALIQLGGELLKAGIQFGTMAYSMEMEKKIAKMTNAQQIIVMQKQAEIDMLLAAQAAEYEQNSAEATTAQVVGITSGVAPYAIAGIIAIGAAMLFRR